MSRGKRNGEHGGNDARRGHDDSRTPNVDRPRTDAVTMGRAGLEPATNGLKGRCSTIELPSRRSAPAIMTEASRFGSRLGKAAHGRGKDWCIARDSNSEPID